MRESSFAWRLEPGISYSDWTIEVTSLPDDHDVSFSEAVVDVYHVHKTFLSCGPRTSAYFLETFQNSGKASCRETRTTYLKLQKSAAYVFPDFLDFVYGGELSLTPESAVALHYLSDFLGVLSLKEAVYNYVRNDMLSKQSCRRKHQQCICSCPEMDSDVDSVVLESCMQSASRWEHVKGHLLSFSCDRTSLVDLMTKMLTLEQKNLLFFYAVQDTSICEMNTSPRSSNIRFRRLEEEKRQDLEHQNADMRQAMDELATVKEKVTTLENQNEAYGHAFSRMKTQCHDLEIKNEELLQRAQQLDEVEAKVASLTARNNTNERLLSAMKEHVQEVEQENAKITQDNEAKKQVIETLTSSKGKLERKLAKAKEKHQDQVALVGNETANLKQTHLLQLSKVKGDNAKLLYQCQSEAARWKEENTKLRRQCELLEELYWTGIGR